MCDFGGGSAPPPPPPAAPPPPMMQPVRIAAPLSQNQDNQRKAKGTASLRIDRAGLNVASGGAGLNIVT